MATTTTQATEQPITPPNPTPDNLVGTVDPTPLPLDGLDTIYQEKNQVISDGGISTVAFVEAITAPLRTNLKGNRIRSKIQNGLKLSFYDKNSFVPTLSNINGSTGTLTEISRNMDGNWVWQSIRIPSSLDATNKDQIMANYYVDDYESILLEAPSFKEDFFNEAKKSLNIKFALDVLIGGNFTTPSVKTYNGSGSFGPAYTVPSFYSLVNSAPATAVNVTAVTPTYLATAASGAKHFNSTATTITGQWSDFKTLIKKLKQKNKLSLGGINAYLNDYVIATSIATFEKIKVQDYQFYKDIEKLQEVGEILIVPETEINVYATAATGAYPSPLTAQLADVTPLPTLALGRFVLVSKGNNALFQPVSNFEKIYAEEFYNNNGNIALVGRQRLGFDVNANSYLVVFDMNLNVSVNQYDIIDITPS